MYTQIVAAYHIRAVIVAAEHVRTVIVAADCYIISLPYSYIFHLFVSFFNGVLPLPRLPLPYASFFLHL
jgi:hypothetical protein